jgi:hypothetical protein
MPFRQPATGIQRSNPVNLILLVGSPVIVKKKSAHYRNPNAFLTFA